MAMDSLEKMYKDKLPWRQVLSLSSANFAQAVMLTMPFTIGVFMVRDFEEAKDDGSMHAVDEQVVGRLTGLLAGIFSFSGFLTAYAWGCASNYIGRKPVIIIGNVVSYISMLWFGLSGSYGTALAARAFGGFFNGILGAWKCMIADSTDVLLQGTFFGYMSLAWGLGCIAGPALGGAFSRPCDRLPYLAGCGAGQLLRARPYFLACLVGSFTLLASLLLSLTLLQETLPQSLREKGVGAALRRWRQRKRDAAALLPEQDGLCGQGAAGAAADLGDDVGTMMVTELAAAKSKKVSSQRAVRDDNDEVDAAAVMMEEEDGRHRRGHEDFKQERVRFLGGDGLGRGRAGGEGECSQLSQGPAGPHVGSDHPIWLTTAGDRDRSSSSGESDAGDTIITCPAGSSHRVDGGVGGRAGGDGSGGGGIGGGSGVGSSTGGGNVVRSASLARLGALLRLTSRNYIGVNAFTRCGGPPADEKWKGGGGSDNRQGGGREAAGGIITAGPSPSDTSTSGGVGCRWGRGKEEVEAVVSEEGAAAGRGGSSGGVGRHGCLQVLGCRGNLEGSTLPPAGRDGDVAEGRRDNVSEGRASELTSALLLHSTGGGGVASGAGGGGVYGRSDDPVWAAIPAPVHPTSHPHNPSNPKPAPADPTLTPPSPITNGAESPPLLDSQPKQAVSLQRVVATSSGLHTCSLGSEICSSRSSAALLGSTTCATRRPQDSSGGCVGVSSSSGSSNSGQSGGGRKSSGGHGDMSGVDSRCSNSGCRESSGEDTSGGVNLHSSSCCNGSDCRRGYGHDNKDVIVANCKANNSFHCTRHEQGMEGTSSCAGLSPKGNRKDRAMLKQPPDDSEHIPLLMVQQLHQQLSCPSISPSTASSPLLPTGTILPEEQGTLKPDDFAAGGAAAGGDNNYSRRGDVGGHICKETDHRSMEVEVAESGTSTAAAAAAGSSPLVPGVQVPWYRQLQVVLAILGYGATALIFCALDEVFPIYASAPKSSGGLGMREEQLATPLMFFGVVLMPYSVYGYPPLQRHVGTLRLTRIGLLAAVFTCGMVPAVAEMESGSHLAGMIMLYGAMVVKAFAQCSAFTGSIIAVNAAPPQDELGAVNGVGQTLAALVRGVGPAVGGVLWAVSLGLHTQGQQFLTFGMISAVAAANWVLYGYVVLPGMR